MSANNPLPDLDLPDALVRNVTGIYGERGTNWLRDLPALLENATDRWQIDLGTPTFALSFHYVVPGRRRTDGLPVVLKLGVVCADLRHEIAALRRFDGRGAARLLKFDAELGALLIERILPGTPLVARADDEAAATRIAADVMQKLWIPSSPDFANDFPTIADWAQGLARHQQRFGGKTGPLSADLFGEAETHFRELLRSSPSPPRLLHGDLHHGNILDAGDGTHVAIDPHGIVGDPAFEPSAFLLNPAPRSPAILARRLDIFAERLALDRERIRRWAIARAILSAVWTIDGSGDDWADAVTVAERL